MNREGKKRVIEKKGKRETERERQCITRTVANKISNIVIFTNDTFSAYILQKAKIKFPVIRKK